MWILMPASIMRTSTDWVKRECLTAEVPDGVVEAYVGPLADGRCVGAGVVDDIYISVFLALH